MQEIKKYLYLFNIRLPVGYIWWIFLHIDIVLNTDYLDYNISALNTHTYDPKYIKIWSLLLFHKL